MSKKSRISSSLEPVEHLSARLQHKLVKRAYRQRKRFRSSGKPYPLVIDMPGTEEKRSGSALASFTTGQRVAFAIVVLVLVILLILGSVAIAAATHLAIGIVLLILVGVALLASAAVMIIRLLKGKP